MADVEMEDTVMMEDMGTVEDTGMAEDIIGVIDLVASRCLAVYQSTNATGTSQFDFGCSKSCTILL